MLAAPSRSVPLGGLERRGDSIGWGVFFFFPAVCRWELLGAYGYRALCVILVEGSSLRLDTQAETLPKWGKSGLVTITHNFTLRAA